MIWFASWCLFLAPGCKKVTLDSGDSSASSEETGVVDPFDTGPADGEVFSAEDPMFVAYLDGSAWVADFSDDGTGYYSSTQIYAQRVTGGDSSETLTLVIDGDLSQAGTWSVVEANYTLQVAQDTPQSYSADDISGLVLRVEGHTEDGMAVFASSEGSAELLGGIMLSDITLTSFPAF